MDLFIWQGAYLLVDGTRIDGATDSYLRRALAVSQPLHGVEEAENEKHTRYPDSPAPMEFKPVAVGTQIKLGASVREVIGMLAKRAAEHTCAGLTPTSAAVARETRIIMGELGIGVMRAQAAQILSYVDGTPHAAIAKILGRGAVRRNLGRRVPAKLAQALCLFGDDLRVRVGAQTLGGAEASTAGPHPNKTDNAHTAQDRAPAASAGGGGATRHGRGGPGGNAKVRLAHSSA